MDRVDLCQIEGHILTRRSVGNALIIALDSCSVTLAYVVAIKTKTTGSLLTTPVSSPGTTLSRSPTCTTPLDNRPVTPTPEATAVCPLKTLEIGNRKGASSDLVGTSTLSGAITSIRRLIHISDPCRILTKNIDQGRSGIPCVQLGAVLLYRQIDPLHCSNRNKGELVE